MQDPWLNLHFTNGRVFVSDEGTYRYLCADQIFTRSHAEAPLETTLCILTLCLPLSVAISST